MSKATPAKSATDLIGQIYDAVLDATEWPLLIERIANVSRSKSGLLRLMDQQCKEVSFVVAHGYDEQSFHPYRNHFIHIDPLNAALKTRPTGTISTTPQVMPMGSFTKTEYYNDYARPQDIYYAAGGFVARDHSRTALLAVQRSKEMGAFEPHELQQLSMLSDHLQRAFQLSRHFGQLQQQSHASEQILEQRPFGVIFFDEFRRPAYLNRRAETLIRLHPQLDIRNGELTTNSAEGTRRLSTLIHDVIETARGNGLSAGGSMQLPTSSAEEPPLTLIVTPLRLSAESFGLSGPRFAAALFLGIPGERQEINQFLLQDLYNLTPAEARLAVELANGYHLEAISERFCLSKHTVRTQLKAIFMKTETRRQAELVKLLLTLPLADD
jgi:DNA-binding CsgD family transcriptional regulator/PAS domain-containing protein